MLLNQPPGPADRDHKVRFGIGAGIEPQLHRVFEERFGFPMIEVWGMTETGRITGDCHEPRMIGTRAFGRPFAGLEARVVDDRDTDVPVGSDGELLVRHSAENPRLRLLLGLPEEREGDRGGLARRLVPHRRRGAAGRVRHAVLRRPQEAHHPPRGREHRRRRDRGGAAGARRVAQVAVVAAPDELREEEVLACIVPMPGIKADAALADALFEQCNARLAYFKAPGWVLFLDKLPTTGTQKVQKTQIFAPGEDPRQRPGIIDLRARKRRS